MVRGVRGATTIEKNEAETIWQTTAELLERMVSVNDVAPEDVAHIWFTVTPDINAAFPAKATRSLRGNWALVPVMCATEIPVHGSLPLCIRVMMTINTEKSQEEIEHIFLHDAVKLRPDLTIDK